jgi:hypothetical protein
MASDLNLKIEKEISNIEQGTRNDDWNEKC